MEDHMKSLNAATKSKVRAYNGFFKIDKYNVEVERFEGGSQTVVRELFERGDAVAVLPFDPKTGNVLMIRQFLIGAHAAGEHDPFSLQVVAGGISPYETPEKAAVRELHEECGLGGDVPYELFECIKYMPSPGGSSERVWTFVALCDLSSLSEGVFGVEDENEDIETYIMPFTEVLEKMYAGEITAGLAVVCIMQLQNMLIQEYVQNMNGDQHD